MRKFALLFGLLLAVPLLGWTQGGLSPSLSASGTITLQTASCSGPGANHVKLRFPSNAASIGVTLAGTWSGTVQFVASVDDVNWAAIAVTPTAGGAAVTSSTANGTWSLGASGMAYLCIYASSYASGAVSVTMSITTGAQAAAVGNAAGSLPLAGGTLGGPLLAPVIDGVSYSVLYQQSTLSGRINACISDAENLANGNTSGICSSVGEAATQTDTSGVTISIGSSTLKATWQHPAMCHWSFSGFTTFVDIMDLWAGSAIVDPPGPVNPTCFIFNTSTTNGANAVFATKGTGYFKVQGMGFANESVTVDSNYTAIVNGAQDESSFDNLYVLSYIAGTSGLYVEGSCCGVNFRNITINDNYTGAIPLTIGANTGPINFFGLSPGHPAAGQPNIYCLDHSANHTDVNFYGIYEEPNNTDTTTAINQVSGCGKVSVYGSQITQTASISSTATGWAVDGTFATQFVGSDLSMLGGFIFPTTMYTNPNDTNAPISSNLPGFVAAINSLNDYANTFNGANYNLGGSSLIPTIGVGDLVYGNTNLHQLARLSASTTAAAEVLVSQATGNAAVPTTKTCAHSAASGLTSACTWSTTPAIGETAVCSVSDANSATFSIADNGSAGGNVYAGIGSVHTATTYAGFTQTFSAPITTSATTTTVTATGTSTGSNLTLACTSTVGIPSSPTVDGQCFGDASTATNSCSSAITTAANGDYVQCAIFNPSGSRTFTIGTGFTSGASSTIGLTQYLVQNPSAAITPSMSVSPTSNTTMTCTAFQASGATQAPVLTNAPAISVANATNFPVSNGSIEGIMKGDGSSINCTAGVCSTGAANPVQVMLGGFNSATPGGTQFAPVNTRASLSGSPPTNLYAILPRAITVTGIQVSLSAAEGAAATLAVTFDACVPSSGTCTPLTTAVTCTVANSATGCGASGFSASVPSGDLIVFQTTQSGTGTAQVGSISATYQ